MTSSGIRFNQIVCILAFPNLCSKNMAHDPRYRLSQLGIKDRAYRGELHPNEGDVEAARTMEKFKNLTPVSDWWAIHQDGDEMIAVPVVMMGFFENDDGGWTLEGIMTGCAPNQPCPTFGKFIGYYRSPRVPVKGNLIKSRFSDRFSIDSSLAPKDWFSFDPNHPDDE